MRSQLCKPTGNVVKSLFLGNVVDEEGTRSSPVVGGSDGSVPVLASSVPNLRLDHVSSLRSDRPRGELDPDSGPRLQIELILAEASQ